MFKRYIVAIFVLFLAASNLAAAYSVPSRPEGFVSDFGAILNSNQKQALESKLSSFKTESSNEIAVVTINSLEGDTIEGVAEKLFNDWKIGSEQNDNGLLLLVAVNDRKMRIETGYGLEGAMPDATAYQIITKTLSPAFKDGDYYGGIDKATDQMIAATRGEYQATSTKSSNWLNNFNLESIFWFVIFFFYALMALWRWLAKSKSWWQGGIIGAAIGLIISLLFFSGLWLVFMLALGALGLLADFMVSRILPAPKPHKAGSNNFWFFGGPGGRGGGSGGFGGFGGGGSGGGGASGSW